MFEYRLVDHGLPDSMEGTVIRQSYECGSERYDYGSSTWVRDEECWFRNVMNDSRADVISEQEAMATIAKFTGASDD